MKRTGVGQTVCDLQVTTWTEARGYQPSLEGTLHLFPSHFCTGKQLVGTCVCAVLRSHREHATKAHAGPLSGSVPVRALLGSSVLHRPISCDDDDQRAELVSAPSLDRSISCFGTCTGHTHACVAHSTRRVRTSVTYEPPRQSLPVRPAAHQE